MQSQRDLFFALQLAVRQGGFNSIPITLGGGASINFLGRSVAGDCGDEDTANCDCEDRYRIDLPPEPSPMNTLTQSDDFQRNACTDILSLFSIMSYSIRNM